MVASGAAVALSYLLKMMTQQAAAAWAAAKEGLHVSEFLGASADLHVSEFLGASAALTLLGMHVKQIKHAAAPTAAANDGWYVPESPGHIGSWCAEEACEQEGSARGSICSCDCHFAPVSFMLSTTCSRFAGLCWNWYLASWVLPPCFAGLVTLDWSFYILLKAHGLVPVSGRNQAFSGKEKNNDDPLLQALTLAEAYECISFKGKDGHDTDVSLSLGKGKASGRVDVPVGVNAFLSAETFCRSEQSVALVYPWLLRRENDFFERGGWEHSGTPGP